MQPPKAIRAIRAEHVIEITWDEGHVARYPTKYVRTSCGCAGCVDERTGERILDADSIPEDIAVEAMTPVGNYAIRIKWSDGHDTGIFSWEFLREICPCPQCRGE